MIAARIFRFWILIATLALLAVALLAQESSPSGQIQAHYQRGQQALEQQHYAQAVKEFQAIVQLNPSLAAAHANLGIAHYLLGEYGEASRALREALRQKPPLKDVEVYLGLSEARQGRFEQALPILEKGFWNSSDQEWRLQAGLLLLERYYATQENEKAVDVVRALQQAFPSHPDVLYIAYRLHSEMGAKAIARLIKAAPGSARLHQVTAELLEAEGDYPRAVRQYRQALAIDPNLAGVNRALGVALLNSATDEASRLEAKQAFERELALNPRDADSEYQLGEIAWRLNDSKQAINHYSRAVELHPAFVDALIALGKTWTATGKTEQAVGSLEKAVEIDPENEVAHYRLAQAYRQLGRNEDAERSLAAFKKLRAAMESLGAIYRQVQRKPITGQTVDSAESQR